MKYRVILPLVLLFVDVAAGNNSKQSTSLEKQYLSFRQLEAFKQKQYVGEPQPLLKALHWHQSFPTTGLRLQKPFYPPPYPFIPHYFSLWQLAPKKGKGVRVATLDTGVAAFTLKDLAPYRKHYDLFVRMPLDADNFNLVGNNGKNPLVPLIELIKRYTQPELFNVQSLEEQLPTWIKNYLQHGDDQQIKHYLERNGTQDVVQHKQLTQAGQKALDALTKGPRGINPREPGAKKPFTLVYLTEPYKEVVVLELLPLAGITKKNTTFVTGHGSHNFGIISAQLTGDGTPEDDEGTLGLAPLAHVFMFKAFKDDGTTNKSTLIAALRKALAHNATVVNLSLKIADTLDLTEDSSQLLESLADAVPYMVAASGNSGDSAKSHVGMTEAYPARFASVAYDVGAFAFEDNKTYIPAFSQYERNVGPLFVAPGFNIASSGLVPGKFTESMYVFMGGTSVATAIMTGFVALMLAEFGATFDKAQLLKVCYKSVLKLEDTHDWKTKVMLGVLDMRTVLFILHALAHLKQKFLTTQSFFDFDEKFDNLLEAVVTILMAQPSRYAHRYLDGIDFQTNFMEFFRRSLARNVYVNKRDFFVPQGADTFASSLDYVLNTVLVALGYDTKGKKAEAAIVRKVGQLLKKEEIDIFKNLTEPIKKRLYVKLHDKKNT